VHAVDGRGACRLQDLVQHEGVDGLGGVDVDRGDAAEVGAERTQPLLHDGHHEARLLAHAVR
jgi:hypothetical protein